MHDLRYDADAHAPDARAYSLPTVKAMDAEVLRTVPMPDLRTAEARALDATTRGLDCRTFDEQVTAELVRIVDVLQVLTLQQELIVAALKRAGVTL